MMTQQKGEHMYTDTYSLPKRRAFHGVLKQENIMRSTLRDSVERTDAWTRAWVNFELFAESPAGAHRVLIPIYDTYSDGVRGRAALVIHHFMGERRIRRLLEESGLTWSIATGQEPYAWQAATAARAIVQAFPKDKTADISVIRASIEPVLKQMDLSLFPQEDRNCSR